ncbi:hypothetical protein Tco_1001039 [Tanacetum coccineum]
MEEDSIDYLNEPEDNDEDPEEDPEEDHTDYPANGEDGDDEPSDDDDDDDDTEDEEPTKDEEEEEHLAPADPSTVPVVDPVPSAGDTKAFETDESAPTPRSPQTRVPFSQTHLRKARKTVRLEPPMSASMVARITKHAAAPIPPTSLAYDQAPLVESSGVAATRPPRAADRAKDVGYVRALQASKHRMMTSIEEVNLRVSYQVQVYRQESEDFYTQLHDTRTDRRDIRLEIDVRAEDDAVRQMMRTHVLEARAQIDTVEDTGRTEGVVGLSDALTWWNGHVRTLGHDAAYDMTWGTLKKKLTDKYCPKETKGLDFMARETTNNEHKRGRGYRVIGCGSDGVSCGVLWEVVLQETVGNGVVWVLAGTWRVLPKLLMMLSSRATTLWSEETTHLLRKGQNDNQTEVDDFIKKTTKPHKKQNVAKAYTAGPGEKRLILEIYLYSPSAITTHMGNVQRECGNCKRNSKENGTTQGRAYALGGRDASPDSNVITGVAPVARAPYRLALSEMKELAEQLQEN